MLLKLYKLYHNFSKNNKIAIAKSFIHFNISQIGNGSPHWRDNS